MMSEGQSSAIESTTTAACACNVSPTNAPHFHKELKPEPAILGSVLEHIGNTPLVRLDRLAKSESLKCDLLAKCEFFNAGGSVKDRIAIRMVEEAEKQGILKPGYTIIEATSGNTGIGLALASAVKGYRCIITLPEKMSREKVDVLKGLGAEIVRTPTDAAWDSPDSHIGVAKRLNKEIPNSVILDQYNNVYNPVAHYDGTAEEILKACNDDIDMIVAGTGTGGTISGLARKIKERCPKCIVVGIDPVGSILADPEAPAEGGAYQVEGIGYDFVPETMHRGLVDRWIKTEDRPSFVMARRLIREEGLLAGGSSGAAVEGAIRAARELGAGKRCVVILPDSVRNYMTKFLNDGWMSKLGFIDEGAEQEKKRRASRWGSATIRDLDPKEAVVIAATSSAREAVEIMQENGFDQLPVISSNTGTLLGIVTLGNVLSRISSGKADADSTVKDVMFRFKTSSSSTFREITLDTRLSTLEEFFEGNTAAIVTERLSVSNQRVAFKPVSVVTYVDILSYLMSHS
ncbi:cystathionine beta-synthase [Mycoemilia scoparia]|uniref:Cystathionine beta-synthase n=1 Tax=Mycoemilia scoparia TaxID=417184 RepID=A0A9W7ZV35_9FUNG|nr:cystathionine beta-synthase [Mycoemilia scoparia]